MNREIANQQSEIKDWPLVKAGDEKFFGYVVALGVLPLHWSDVGGLIAYVDFAYSDDYDRYRLPDDESLRAQLRDMLAQNMDAAGNADGIYGKVWIKRDEAGYSVALP